MVERSFAQRGTADAHKDEAHDGNGVMIRRALLSWLVRILCLPLGGFACHGLIDLGQVF